jgi:ABC-type transporter Mla subunit MlaD
MADSIHASYGKIGFAVVAGLVAVIGMLIYIGGLDGKKGVIYAETYSDSPVSGLAVGSDVNMRGVKVGEVKEISFVGSEYEGVAENDIPKIYIRLAIDPRKLRVGAGEDPEEVLRRIVKKGLHATVASSGITGLSKIELNFPKDGIADQRISWVPRSVCIPPAPSMLESFSDSVTKFVGQLSRLELETVWSNITSVAESSASITKNVDELVDSAKGGVESAVRSIDEAAAQVRELAGELRANPSLLLRPNDPEPLPETSR